MGNIGYGVRKMAISLIRTLILYFLIIISFRWMGKRQIGELQPSELVLAIMISDLATVSMQSTGNPLISGIIPIIALTVCEIVLSFVSQKSVFFRKLVTGTPSLVITNGKINIAEMKKLRFNIDDLFEQLRIGGYTTVSDIAYAVLETNGQLSIVPKEAVRPVCPKDLNLKPEKATLSRNIIKDGTVDKINLKEIGKNEAWLLKILEKNHIKNPKDVFLLSADYYGNIYLQKREE